MLVWALTPYVLFTSDELAHLICLVDGCARIVDMQRDSDMRLNRRKRSQAAQKHPNPQAMFDLTFFFLCMRCVCGCGVCGVGVLCCVHMLCGCVVWFCCVVCFVRVCVRRAFLRRTSLRRTSLHHTSLRRTPQNFAFFPGAHTK